MKLADFLFENSMTPKQLRRMLGVQSRSTMSLWLLNERIPQPRMMKKIEELTGGQVRREDFLDPSPPNCARVVTDRHGRKRWRLPWSPKRTKKFKPCDPRLAQFSPPVQRALKVLKKRVWITAKGRLLLDGRITDLKRVMRAANDELRRRGQPPIPYPGVEPLDDEN